ncbi:MAG: sulfite exporter TauE/SafE family protein [Saprospiraceae bacterium]|nr:sulfite exporter TauE/SafE family protein [Saprospiraceae bacterium]
MNVIGFAFAGLSLGLLGSLHCIGMCGPIALGFTGQQEDFKKRMYTILLYNFGRTLSYTAMGFILGIIGNQFAFSGYQQILSIVAGVFVLVIMAAKYLNFRKIKFLASWDRHVQLALYNVMKKPKTILYHLEVGIINAWLPCGLVYIAIASALASGSLISGTILMFFFGLGTMPLMISVMMLGKYMSISLRAKINRLIPVFILVTSSLLILRGMNLGIPYVSPMVDVQGKCVKNCCHR